MTTWTLARGSSSSRSSHNASAAVRKSFTSPVRCIVSLSLSPAKKRAEIEMIPLFSPGLARSRERVGLPCEDALRCS